MASTNAKQLLLKLTTVDIVGGIYCKICKTTISNKQDYDAHYKKHSNDKEITYTCTVCYKDLTRYSCFRDHCYTNHVIKNKFTCEDCNKHFSKITKLRDHIKLMHQLECKTCKKCFTTKKELRLHNFFMHKDSLKDMTCQVCEEDVSTIDACKRHIDMHFQNHYVCPICQEKSMDKSQTMEHLMKHFNNMELLNSICCDVCAAIFPSWEKFYSHFSSEHVNEKIKYTCYVCEKQFADFKLFKAHTNGHTVNNEFSCDECNMKFPHLSLLVSHISTCSTNRKKHKPYICFLCGHRYLLEHSLFKHIAESHNNRTFCCAEPGCKQIFEKRRDLILHNREHNTAVQNWCRQCGQDFISLVSWEEHLEAHKVQCYACPVCSKQYAEKKYLEKHIPHHFNAVLHMCKVCGKIYDHKRRLIEHLKTHSEQKNYPCTHCSKTFAKSSHLIQHLGTHDKDKQYNCTVCEKTFSCTPNLMKHLTRMHKVPSDKAIEIQDANISLDNKPKNKENNENSNDPTLEWNEVFMDEMESEVIDEVVIEKELNLFGKQDVIEFRDTPTVIFESTVDSSKVPLEYGPDITHTDDHMLPHIDPLLTIKSQPIPVQSNDQSFKMDTNSHIFDQDIQITTEKWEPPIISKLYYGFEDSNQLTIMNNIY